MFLIHGSVYPVRSFRLSHLGFTLEFDEQSAD
jgi:hypothetical protein